MQPSSTTKDPREGIPRDVVAPLPGPNGQVSPKPRITFRLNCPYCGLPYGDGKGCGPHLNAGGKLY